MKNVIDKNLGENSIPVTKDKFMDEKDKKIKAKSLETIQRLKKTQSNQLKKEDNILIDDILKRYSEGKIIDVLLCHFIKEKLRLTEEYKEKQHKVKMLQMNLLEQINEVTNDVVKTKNNLDFIDKSILNHINK